MSTVTHSRPPLQPGEPAPDFTLPTVPDDGVVSLAEYRGRSPLLLVLLRTVGG
jgi:peroxiredoxin